MYSLLQPTQLRGKCLAVDCAYLTNCKCSSCTLKLPPFKATGLDGISKSLLDLLNLLQGKPFPMETRVIGADRDKLKEYEKCIIEHLQRTDHLHPTEATLKLQFLLMQIWSNQYSMNPPCYVEPIIVAGANRVPSTYYSVS